MPLYQSTPTARPRVARPHGRGCADYPFLGRQGEGLRRAVLQPHGRGYQVVRAELKILHDAQAVGESFLGAHPVVDPGQGEDSVALHGLAVEQR